MQKVIKRDEYLGRLIDKKENGLIKVNRNQKMWKELSFVSSVL